MGNGVWDGKLHLLTEILIKYILCKILNNNLEQFLNINADLQFKAQTKLGTQEITILKNMSLMKAYSIT